MDSLATPGSKTSLEFEVSLQKRVSILSEGLLALKWASIFESPYTDSRQSSTDCRLASHTPGLGLDRGVATLELTAPLYKGQNLCSTVIGV